MRRQREEVKQFNQVYDFEDDSRPTMTEWVGRLLKGIFAGAGVAMLVCTLFLAIVEYMR